MVGNQETVRETHTQYNYTNFVGSEFIKKKTLKKGLWQIASNWKTHFDNIDSFHRKRIQQKH